MRKNLHVEYQAMRRERFKRGLYTVGQLSRYIPDRTKIKVLRLQFSLVGVEETEEARGQSKRSNFDCIHW